MKRIYSTILVVTVLAFNSCSSDEEADPVIVTTSNLTLEITDDVTGGDILTTVPGTSNQGAVDFNITSQTPNGATTLNNGGTLVVLDDDVFDAAVNPQIVVSVAVSKEDVIQTSTITLNLVSSDTDGDGVTNAMDEAPNDPCIPAQMEGYTGFDATNAIWAAADCDNDGTDNGSEVTNGTDPYKEEVSDTCDSTVETTIWEGNLTSTEDLGDGSPIIIDAEGVAGCGTLILKIDILEFECPTVPELLIKFTPVSDDATNGSIVVDEQNYQCGDDGSPTTISATGTYNEITQTITLNYTAIEEAFPDEPLEGTVEITLRN